MKIYFICRDVYYFDYPLIAQALSQDFGMETYAVTFSSKTAGVIESKHPASFKEIYNLDDYFAQNKDFRDVSIKEKIEYLTSIEQKLNIPSLFSLVYVERTLVKHGYEEMITIAYGMGRFVEALMGKEIHYVIGEIGTFLEYLLWKYSSLAKFPYFFPSASRFKGRIAFFMGEKGEAWGLKENYEHYKNSELTPEEVKLFDEFYEDFLEGRKKPECSERINLYKKVRSIVHAYRERARFKNKSRYIFESIDTSSIRQLISLRLRKFFSKIFLRLNGTFKPLRSDKFIFYPLHVDPEISTLLYAPYYVDQLAFIENVAKSIPVDYILVVKEHPWMYGLRAPSFYRKLSRMPNVRLIHPLEDSYKIIRGSDAVVVLTGTVGLESILLEKPLIVLGDVFYDVCALAHKVENIKELPDTLKKVIANYKKDRITLKRFILAYMRSTYDGIIDNPIEKRDLLSTENVGNIAKAIFHVCTSATR